MAGYTKMVYPKTVTHVTHPSINRARRRVTTLIETDALPLSQATTSAGLKEKIKAQIKIQIREAAINDALTKDKTAMLTTTVNQVTIDI